MPPQATCGQARGGAGRKGPAYDRRITVFSPDGRLYQVEYALKAVKLPGITSVAVRGADSVCVVTQRTASKDPLLDRTVPVFSHLFKITMRMALLVTGMEADGRSLAHQARNEAAEFRFKWGYEMPPRVLARWIADRAQICTQHAGMRPYGVAATILGIDEDKGTPELFTCDPAGLFFGCKAASAGLKEREAIKFLEDKMMNNPSLSLQSTVEMALCALRHILEGSGPHEIEIGVVRKDYPFRALLTRIYKSPPARQSSTVLTV